MVLFEPECSPKCRSKNHALQIVSAITKASLRQFKAYCRLCHQATLRSDTHGRTCLHVAAACGKCDIIEWLLTEKGSDVSAKDLESGWCALHRALFYGQIAAARLLCQFRTDLSVRDHEGLAPFDILMKDRPGYISYTNNDQNETYTWGDNANYTLGHPNELKKSVPECVDFFRKQSVRIKQVVLSKFHTVFLSYSGQVYTCGHGHGGRLGHGNEQACLIPTLVETLNKEVCSSIAASRDHTVFQMESGLIYSCGLNDSHQLGQIPIPDKSLTPKLVTQKSLKGEGVHGICCGRFHTVLYSQDSVYTFGLNAGQLGHPKGDKLQSTPRQVSAFNYKDMHIAMVSCSDAATVVMSTKGDIYVIQEFHCRKIASKWLDIVKIHVAGGHLDHNYDLDVLQERGGSELFIMLLNASGKVFLWRASNPSVKRCHWLIKRQLCVVDISLNSSNVAIVTDVGEAFIGTVVTKKLPTHKEVSSKYHSGSEKAEYTESISLMDLLLRDPIEEVQIYRVPNVQRGTVIASDKKGRNFAVLQSLPNTFLTEVPVSGSSEMQNHFRTLLNDCDECDLIHDVVIKIGKRVWPAHRYIICSRSDHFRKLVSEAVKSVEYNEIPVISLDEIHPDIFSQLLCFLYTDTCDVLKVGTNFELADSNVENSETVFSADNTKLTPSNGKSVSAFSVLQESKKKVKKKEMKDKDNNMNSRNPVKYLQELGRKFGVKGLVKRLDAVKYVKGTVQSTGKHIAPGRVRFDRKKLPEFHDVCIKSQDNKMVECHKCVLVARLEYFHSMLASGWIETSNSTALTLPVPGDILEILLDYLYMDESVFVEECKNVELLCNILVVADQFLVTRLKDICEVAIASLISLKNAGELLEFSTMYNAAQLKVTCQQFICINLGSLLEGRHLDVLSDDVLEDLKTCYRNLIPAMSKRLVTPYEDGPDMDYLESLERAFTNDDLSTAEHINKKSSNKPKKRRSRNKSFSDDVDKSSSSRRQRNISTCSDVSVRSEEDDLDISSKELVLTPRQECIVKESSPALTEKVKTGISDIAHSLSLITTEIDKSRKAETPEKKNRNVIWTQESSPSSELHSEGRERTFRDIMEEEDKLQKSLASSKTPQKLSGKFSWKDVKKQQNKTSPFKTSEPLLETSAILSKHDSEPNIKERENSCPWTSVKKVTQSFRDLMKEESKHSESRKIPSPSLVQTSSSSKTGSPSNASLSWGLPSRTTPRQRKSSQTLESDDLPSPPASAENPWQRLQPTTAAECSVSFTDIMKDEIQMRDTLHKASNKPLGLIQMEECAIQELLKHYNADACVDERITVGRVHQAMAAPLWKVEKPLK